MRLRTLLPAGGCKGTTKKGQPCQAKDLYENQRCRHHGGEGKLLRLELLKERFRRKAKRLLERSRRVERMLVRAAKKDPKFAAMLERIKNKNESRFQKLAGLVNVAGLASGPKKESSDVRSEDSEGNTLQVPKAL